MSNIEAFQYHKREIHNMMTNLAPSRNIRKTKNENKISNEDHWKDEI